MSEETAIQEDVVEEEVTEEVTEDRPEQEEDPRQALYRKRSEQIRAEADELPNKQMQDEEEEEEDADEPPEPQEPEMIDLKVDGEVIQKPKEEVDAEGGVAAMQKKLSGEKRLAEAAEERKRLAQERERFEREREEFQKQKEQAQEPPQKESGVTDEAVTTARKQYINAVYSGDEEEIEKALENYETLQFERFASKVNQAKPIDPDEIAGRVKQEVAFDTSLTEGRRQFNETYSHLAEDPYLHKLTNEKTAELRREHPEWTPAEVIVKAAKEVDEWYQKLKPQDTAEDLIAKQKERKQNKDTIPTANSKKQGVGKNKAKSPRDVFEEMRAGRVA